MPIGASAGTLDIENATLRSNAIAVLTNLVAGNDQVRQSGPPALEVYGDPSHGGNEPRLELVSNITDTVSNSFTRLTSNAGVFSIETGTSGTSDNGTITFGGFQNERLRITSDGNVGVGTTNPNTKFTLYGDDTQDEGGLLMKVVNRVAFDNGFTGIGLGGYATTSAPIIQVAKSAIIHERTGYNGTGNLMFCNDDTTDNNDVSNTHARMTITGAGNVGIGTTNPVGVNGGQRLEGSSSTGFEYIATRDDTTGVVDDFVGAYLFKNTDADGNEPHYAGMSAKMTGTNGPMDLRFHANRDQYETDAVPAMIINSAGRVGIGKTDPNSALDVIGDLILSGVSSGWRRRVFKDEYSNGVTKSWKRIAYIGGGSGVLRIHGVMGGHARNTTGEGQVIFDILLAARSGAIIRGNISGRIPSGTGLNIEARGVTGGGETGDNLTIYLVKEDYSAFNITCEAVHGITLHNDNWSTTTPSGGVVFNLSSYAASERNNTIGNLHVHGTLSKGAGTFLIDHPLPEKKNTHYLQHSFIEAPRAELIYRGKVTLENGVANVNIDLESNMTDGTFITLNENVQCFTSNETNWENVRGAVNGNILTISSQNSNSNVTVSWMVIGQRCDTYMKECNLTDDKNIFITEPQKEIVNERSDDDYYEIPNDPNNTSTISLSDNI
jgi:hypothetical protein